MWCDLDQFTEGFIEKKKLTDLSGKSFKSRSKVEKPQFEIYRNIFLTIYERWFDHLNNT